MSLSIVQGVVNTPDGGSKIAISGLRTSIGGRLHTDETATTLSEWGSMNKDGKRAFMEGTFGDWVAAELPRPNFTDFPCYGSFFTRSDAYSLTWHRNIVKSSFNQLLLSGISAAPNHIVEEVVELRTYAAVLAPKTNVYDQASNIGTGINSTAYGSNGYSSFIWKRLHRPTYSSGGATHAYAWSKWELQNPTEGWMGLHPRGGFYNIEPQLRQQWLTPEGYNPSTPLRLLSIYTESQTDCVIIVDCRTPSVAGTPTLHANFGTVLWSKPYTCTVGKSFRLLIDMTGYGVTLVTAIEYS